MRLAPTLGWTPTDVTDADLCGSALQDFRREKGRVAWKTVLLENFSDQRDVQIFCIFFIRCEDRVPCRALKGEFSYTQRWPPHTHFFLQLRLETFSGGWGCRYFLVLAGVGSVQ